MFELIISDKDSNSLIEFSGVKPLWISVLNFVDKDDVTSSMIFSLIPNFSIQTEISSKYYQNYRERHPDLNSDFSAMLRISL